LLLVLQNESHHQRHAIAADFAIFDVDFLVFDPGTFDVIERLASAGDAFFDGVLKAFFAGIIAWFRLSHGVIAKYSTVGDGTRRPWRSKKHD